MEASDHITDDEIATFREKLLEWFETERRDFPWRTPGATAFTKVVAEVFLQRTTAAAVAAVLPRFIERFPSWESIARATEDELGEVIRPLGLWRRRTPALRALAEEMVSREGQFPDSREEVQSLPAVGQYIANAILLSVHGQAEPLIDVNMARVLERYFGPRTRADIRYDPYLQSLSRRVVAGANPEEVNWAILDFGALVCRARNPRCPVCPELAGCRFGRTHAGIDSPH